MEGLTVLGFSRAPGVAVSVGLHPFAGKVVETASGIQIQMGARILQRDLYLRQSPDHVFQRSVEESLHSRQPRALLWQQESGRFPGYEEGAAHGLARLITTEKAGMALDGNESYESYVVAYRKLAEGLGMTPEVLLRRFVQEQPGSIRERFADVVDEMYRQQTGFGLDTQRRAAASAAADQLFSIQLRAPIPLGLADETGILSVWQQALP